MCKYGNEGHSENTLAISLGKCQAFNDQKMTNRISSKSFCNVAVTKTTICYDSK